MSLSGSGKYENLRHSREALDVLGERSGSASLVQFPVGRDFVILPALVSARPVNQSFLAMNPNKWE